MIVFCPSCAGFTGSLLHIWKDEVGDVQDIPQGDGGDQGDPLMPLLFSLAMHPSLVSTGPQCVLDETENLQHPLWFANEIHVVQKGKKLFTFSEEITHSRITVHCGKTQLWNRSGTTPRGCEDLTRAARALNPDVQSFGEETVQQGVVVLRSPVTNSSRRS